MIEFHIIFVASYQYGNCLN